MAEIYHSGGRFATTAQDEQMPRSTTEKLLRGIAEKITLAGQFQKTIEIGSLVKLEATSRIPETVKQGNQPVRIRLLTPGVLQKTHMN